MRDFGDYHWFALVPETYGGLGFPADASLIIKHVPEEIQFMICNIYNWRQTPEGEVALQVARGMRSVQHYARGRPESVSTVDPYHELMVEFLPTVTLSAIEYDHPHKGRPRMIDLVRNAERRGYSVTPAPRRFHRSFLDDPEKPKRGWATAPLSHRLQEAKARCPEMFLECKLDNLEDALKAKTFHIMEPRRYILPGMTIYADDEVQPLRYQTPSESLSFRIPNKVLFEPMDEVRSKSSSKSSH